jgi:hypothetical protein
MRLFQISIGLFAVAGLLGLYLLTLVLRNKETRKGFALIHGPLAMIGVILLASFAIRNHENQYFIAISIFALSAVGGFVLIAKDLTGGKPPKWLAILHGLLAVAGLTLALTL